MRIPAIAIGTVHEEEQLILVVESDPKNLDFHRPYRIGAQKEDHTSSTLD